MLQCSSASNLVNYPSQRRAVPQPALSPHACHFFQMMASSINLFHITCFYITSMFSEFIFRFPVPLILLIQKGHNTHQQTSFELKKFCTEFANVTSLPMCVPQVVDVPEYFIEQEGFCNLTSCYCFARPIYDKK